MHAIHRLRDLGQSVWLDFIDRSLLTTGKLDRMIEEDGLAGMTSNPTIFQKAVAKSSDYDALIRQMPAALSHGDVFERIQMQDITLACDRFRGLYERLKGADGFVSIEVSPLLAHAPLESISAARRLWKAVGRTNLMVKIPATREGLAAIKACLTEGININVTLLFSVDRYRDVAEAYLQALEARVADGQPIDTLSSVASFFVSRVDTKVDKALDALPEPLRERGRGLRGQIAIANAKLAYEAYEHIFAGERWKRLVAKGARSQRLLWGSTSPKDPAYNDLHYVEALIGKDTVDTMPIEIFEASIDHAQLGATLAEGRSEARARLSSLAGLGIDLARVTDELEEEGVRAFAASFHAAEKAIGHKRGTLRKSA